MTSLLLPLLAAIAVLSRTASSFAPSTSGLEASQFSRRIRNSSSALRSSTAASAPATRPLPEGITKTIVNEGTGRSVRVGDVLIVKFFCNAVGSDTAFARSERQRVMVGDGTFVPGFDAALRSMREGERAAVTISDPRYGYGEAGVPPFVLPNSQIEMDLEILDVEDAVGLSAAGTGDLAGLDGMGMDGPVSRPRTPAAIAAAYEQRMRQKAIDAPPEKEGLEWVVDKVRTSYFFGIFEGETGQEAPWYLKPSITFPIAFLVCGAAFGASILGGAITERGMPSTDELDEILTASNLLKDSVVVAIGPNVDFGL